MPESKTPSQPRALSRMNARVKDIIKNQLQVEEHENGRQGQGQNGLSLELPKTCTYILF
jgi:hypothetical protein